ncbi:MFS transporter [Yinghuangia seranimata]|uniref:MFS transporter n=1 Tax=Yinghuangia seranimata TaxID=408067 RepID=UPI00248B8193|nr:MFS transporter [Yinghuangia seranimata]MDI2126228.1 MFS transporter [Yinghuangia seranimata]
MNRPSRTTAQPAPTAHEAPTAPKPRRGPGPAVVRWLFAFGASIIGDQIWFLALSWSAVEQAGAAAAGVVVTLGTLPRAALMLPGGAIADRFGARRIVIGSDLVRCVTMAVAAALLVFASPGIGLLAAVALLFGAVDALFMPAVGALPATLTTRDQFARVQGLRSLVTRIASIASAPAGGIALAQGGAGTALTVSAVLFGGSLVLLWRLRPVATEPVATSDAAPEPGDERGEDSTAGEPHEAAGTEGHGIRAGLRYVWSVPVLKCLVLIGLISELGFSAPMNLGLALLSQDRGWGPGGLGLLLGAWGVGAVATGLVLSVRGHVPHAGRVLIACFAVGGVGTAVMGYAPNLAVAVAGSVVLGLASGFVGTVAGALLQTTAETRMLGRVVALQMLCAVGVIPMSYPLAGLLAGAAGPAAVFGVGAVLGLVAAVAATLAPALRRAELPRPDTA